MKDLSFTYNPQPGRIVFGANSLERLPDEVAGAGLSRALVLCTPEQVEHGARVRALLGDAAAGIYDRAVMHVPVETVADAMETVRRLGADCCVAIGGGSTIGLAKAIALESSLPVIAVPTTYAGSEVTPIWGLTRDGIKTTGKDARVLPRIVIYDPLLTMSLPAAITGPSGMNAVAHCVEALYAEDRNPVTSMMAAEGIRAMGQHLPAVVADGGDVAARSGALYGAWLAGAALGTVGMALHHKLCHTLGGSFNLPHAEVHTVILPYATWYNEQAAAPAMARVCAALDAATAPGGLWDLARQVGAPASLAELGMTEAQLDQAADITLRNPYYNPAPVEKAGIRRLLQAALEGGRPEGGF